MRKRVAKKVLKKKESLKYNKWQLSEAEAKSAKADKRAANAASE